MFHDQPELVAVREVVMIESPCSSNYCLASLLGIAATWCPWIRAMANSLIQYRGKKIAGSTGKLAWSFLSFQ
jgi:hypothetical protein